MFILSAVVGLSEAELSPEKPQCHIILAHKWNNGCFKFSSSLFAQDKSVVNICASDPNEVD